MDGSRGSINHPTNTRSNLTALTEASSCDNVLLEYQLSLEMYERGLLDFIYPVMLGDYDESGDMYSNYFTSGSHPNLSEHKTVVVKQVELKVHEHLDRLCLGTSLLGSLSVEGTLSKLLINQGSLTDGARSKVFEQSKLDVKKMISLRLVRDKKIDEASTARRLSSGPINVIDEVVIDVNVSKTSSDF